MSGDNKTAQAWVKMSVVLHYRAGVYGDDCTVGQVRAQASREAEAAFDRLRAAGLRMTGGSGVRIELVDTHPPTVALDTP